MKVGTSRADKSTLATRIMADEKHQEKVCLRNVRPEESQSSTSERALMKMVVKEIPPRELQSKEL